MLLEIVIFLVGIITGFTITIIYLLRQVHKMKKLEGEINDKARDAMCNINQSHDELHEPNDA